jgi:hypothetical protein
MNDSNLKTTLPGRHGLTDKSAHQGVDKSLIKLFLAMSPEERLLSNDNTIQTLTELKYAFNQKSSCIRSQRASKRS